MNGRIHRSDENNGQDHKNLADLQISSLCLDARTLPQVKRCCKYRDDGHDEEDISQPTQSISCVNFVAAGYLINSADDTTEQGAENEQVEKSKTSEDRRQSLNLILPISYPVRQVMFALMVAVTYHF